MAQFADDDRKVAALMRLFLIFLFMKRQRLWLYYGYSDYRIIFNFSLDRDLELVYIYI